MTGRQLINSALRAVNAIGTTEAATNDMFENSRELLNMILGSMSAEELMPGHFSPFVASLYAAVPNYTINAGDAYDSDSICMNQKPASSGEQSLTLNGTYVTSSVATPDVPRQVIITSTGDDSGRTFVLVGTSLYGDYLTETLTGPNAASVRSDKQFRTVTSITIDNDSTGRITVGTDVIINMRRPTQTVYAYIRDPDGADTPLMIVDRNRYDEIPDKDEAGTPTRLFYDRSMASGEIHVHPVPAGGLALDVSAGSTEHITNGDFAAGTDWTLESQWAITANKLVRTPGNGAEQLGSELLQGNDATFDDGSDGNWVTTSSSYFNVRADGGDGNSGCLTIAETINSGGWGIADSNLSVALKNSTIYRATVNILNIAGTIPFRMDIVGAATYGPGYTNISSNGEYSTPITTVTVVDQGPVLRIRKDTTGGIGQSGYVDSPSLKEVTGYDPQGADTASQLTGDLAVAFTTGSTYRLTFTVSSFTAGSCTPSIGGTSGTAISSDGDYSEDIVAGSGTSFILSASSDFDGTFDDIAIIEVTDGTSTAGTAYDLHLDLWLPFVEIAADEVDSAINLPGEYLLAFRWNLAAALAPEYGRDVSTYVFIRAKETKDTIKMLNAMIPKYFNLGTPLETVDGQPAANVN